MKARLMLLPLILFVMLIAGFGLALLRGEKSTSILGASLGQAASGFIIDRYDPAAWRGRAYVVNFFASWCVPCRAEHPVLQELAKTGVPLIGIAYRDQPAAIEKFLSMSGNVYSLLAYDPKGRGAIEWGLTGVPETFLVDAAGVIRFHQVGPLTAEAAAQLQAALEQITAEVKSGPVN